MSKNNISEYRGLTGKTYRLSDRLDKGGEGAVYRIQGQPASVAKIYNNKKTPEELRNLFEKLKVMIDMNIHPYHNGLLVVTWPQDILEDNNGKFAGYIMPILTGYKSLIIACRPTERAKLLYGSDYTWKKSIATAYNLSIMVDCLHKFGIVIGDMNAKNIRVNSHGHVTLIDCDSFQVKSRSGKLYKCTVGLAETEPAEIQGRDMRKQGNDFTIYSDRFALAIHIFSLLCNGFHPFNVIKPKTGGSSSSGSAGTQVKNITQGYCPYVIPGNKAKLPLEVPDMEMLPDYIMNLFRRAFEYDATNAVLQSTIQKRPSAAEWRDALGKLFNERMTVCSKNHEHVYLTAYGKCPWCEAEAKSRPAKQPSKVVTVAQNYTQRAYQKVAPTHAAAAAQRFLNATTPKKWTYTPATYRRDATPLYLLCLIVGMVGAAMPLQVEMDVVYQVFGYHISSALMTILSLIFGLIGGWLVATWAKERYLRAVNAWPQLWFALLAPPVSWIGMALVLLAIAVIVAIVYLFISLIVIGFIIAVIGGS